jgi:adenylate kinase family enzyme
MKSKICIITGPCGSGKSTIAKKLANDIPNSVFLEVDILREMIKNGGVAPFPYRGEAKKQIHLSMKNSCILAKNFSNSGFNVFIEDVLEKKDIIDYYKENLKGAKIFLILPNKKILKKRDASRKKIDVMGKRALELHNIFTSMLKKEKRWIVMDNSNESKKETTKKIWEMLK